MSFFTADSPNSSEFSSSLLRNLAIIVAFSGSTDAGNTCHDLAEHLIENYPNLELAPIEDERFFDLGINPPITSRTGEKTQVEWPKVRFTLLRHTERELVIISGPEPSHFGKSFAAEVTRRISELEPAIVVSLAAISDDAPHSRDLPVKITTADAEAIGYTRSIVWGAYSGMRGAAGVVASFLAEDFPSAQVFTSVPNYVEVLSNPKSQLTMLKAVEDLLDIPLARGDLEARAERWTAAVQSEVSGSYEMSAHVEKLEMDSDVEAATGFTSRDIADEIEDFLRDDS